ncbi:MAG: NAD(P)H-hydrate dehydratase, partial [Burkholderiaceae bacterium]|nr:NAD(P)H-hydrate dehydratase [Burkholderiaceae bacterium]
HKGSFGSVAIVGGGLGMVGAPLLAARAALRLGAGRVYVECIGAPDLRFDPAQPELMFRRLASLAQVDAIVVGCGLATDAAAAGALAAAFERSVPLVVDADALNLLADRARFAGIFEAHAAGRVLTPHPLEAARLLGATAHEVQADRVAAARALARQTASIVVLKGAGTVIAHPAGRWWINPTGGPALATAGTGDVLAGMIGAFVAQGIEPIQAALAAAWLHGRAADEYGGDVGLVAGELAARAARVLVRLRGQDAQA